MTIKNIKKMDYFTAADGCKITETFGIPTENIKDASVAFAILPKGEQTDPHHHNFLEWYIITAGKGMMRINDKEQEIGVGDNILIKKKEWHSIKTLGNSALEFYCFCVPAFTLEGTTMQDGTKAKEDINRKFK